MKISGKKIKDARLAKNMSRAELSRRSGVPVRTLEDWESGRRNPMDVDVVISVSKALDVDLGELYSDEYIHILNAQALSDMDRFSDDEEVERLLLTKIDAIYTEQGETGLARLLDRFIGHVGLENALEIVEGYMHESSND